MAARQKKNPTVTIAVTAYNEAENIRSFLNSAISQSEEGFALEKILVISDGSTDNTACLARSVKHANLEVREHAERKGKAVRLNETHQSLISDILIVCDADTVLAHQNVIRDLIRPVTAEGVTLACGNIEPAKACTFVERAMHLGFEARQPFRNAAEQNIYSVNGALMAYSALFAKRTQLPKDAIGIDYYLYFACREAGEKYRFVPSAKAWFRMPGTLRDAIVQNVRYSGIRGVMEKRFDPELVRREYAVPERMGFRHKLRQFVYHPILGVAAFLIYRMAGFRAKFGGKGMTGQWGIATSTKDPSSSRAGYAVLPTASLSSRARLALFVGFFALVLMFSLRGIAGNPTHETLNDPKWKEEGPLELSPDRGRFALTFSIVEDHSLKFSLPVARFTTPDLGITPDKRNYVSLFAPGLSFLAMPGYVLGRVFGMAQVGTFAVVALFALLNVLLIRAIAMRLGASATSASLGAFAFLFATPAFAYAVTLYQHHVSTFFILLAIYALMRWNNLWSLSLVWFLCAASIVVDNPNVFLMFPIGIFALGRVLWFEERGRGRHALVLRPLALYTLAVMFVPISLFLAFNYASHGDALKLSGTLQAVKVVGEDGRPAASVLDKPVAEPKTEQEKTAAGFFRTRNLLNGLYTHFISPDRGIIEFAPVVLLGIFGFIWLYRNNVPFANLLLAVIGVNILLYSMWGDPWGGWAFGSRYLIPTYALLGIGVGLALTAHRKSEMFLIMFVILASYGLWVNSLGAVTSSRNPPQVEVLALEAVTNKEEKYTWMRNLQFLEMNRSKAFMFQEVFGKHMSAMAYHRMLLGILGIGFLGMVLAQWVEREKEVGDTI
jgi:glycosyltransferase involved in cell wall biosynthesis